MSNHSNTIPGTYNKVSTQGGNIAFIHRIIDGEPLLSIDRATKVSVDADRWAYELDQSSVLDMIRFFEWLLQSDEAVPSMFTNEDGKWRLTDPKWEDSSPMSRQLNEKITILYWPTISKKGLPAYVLTFNWFPGGVFAPLSVCCTLKELSVFRSTLCSFVSNCPAYHDLIHNILTWANSEKAIEEVYKKMYVTVNKVIPELETKVKDLEEKVAYLHGVLDEDVYCINDLQEQVDNLIRYTGKES